MGVRVVNNIPRVVAKARARSEIAARTTAEAVLRHQRANIAVDTGDARDSLVIERHGDGYRVGPTVFYGHLIEFGSVNNAPHPYLIPSAEAGRAVFIAQMRKIA